MPHRSFGPSVNRHQFPEVLATGTLNLNDGTVRTIDDVELGFTAAQLADAHRAVIAVENATCSYRYDSGAAAGLGASANYHYLIDPAFALPTIISGPENIANIAFLRTTATSARVIVTLER